MDVKISRLLKMVEESPTDKTLRLELESVLHRSDLLELLPDHNTFTKLRYLVGSDNLLCDIFRQSIFPFFHMTSRIILFKNEKYTFKNLPFSELSHIFLQLKEFSCILSKLTENYEYYGIGREKLELETCIFQFPTASQDIPQVIRTSGMGSGSSTRTFLPMSGASTSSITTFNFSTSQVEIKQYRKVYLKIEIGFSYDSFGVFSGIQNIKFVPIIESHKSFVTISNGFIIDAKRYKDHFKLAPVDMGKIEGVLTSERLFSMIDTIKMIILEMIFEESKTGAGNRVDFSSATLIKSYLNFTLPDLS